MPLFKTPVRQDKKSDLSIAKKANTAKVYSQPTVVIKGSGNLVDRIATIKAMVDKYLGKYKDEYTIIRDAQSLRYYLNQAHDEKVISIDTETDGLDPMLNHIAGICLYIPKCKPAYIPIGHISYITNDIAPNQIGIKVVEEQFTEFFEHKNVEVVMFNADFDIRVLRNQCNIKNVYCSWDCYLAARLLNENEPSNTLKKLHQKYVLNDAESEFKFDELFKGIPFTMIPITTGYLYAAHDAIDTYELYMFQKKYLDLNSERQDMRDIAWVFHNIEMPCVSVVADMEDNGVLIDLDYAHSLSVKYNALLAEKTDNFYNLLSQYEKDIELYKAKNPNHKLSTPLNIASPTQIAILLYDILQIDSVDKKNPRGTGEEILRKIDNPIAKAILDYREVSKLISTYIDKLPECVNPNDGRIHCRFNQYGADTGRFSSSDPNLQNIPSHNKDIRKMFVATGEEKLVSTDTQQFVVDRWCEVECAGKWKFADKIVAGDRLLTDDGDCLNVIGTTISNDSVIIEVI